MTKRDAKKVRGLFTALITSFDEKGRVDPDRLTKLVKFQVSKGVDGIFPCGSTGQGPLLKLEERKVVAETVVRTAGSRVPVVVQVGSADTASTVELARHAEEVGAYAVASLTPYYYKPGEKAILKHFEEVTRAVDIPVLAYNIPPLTGNNLAPSFVAELAKAGMAGIKDSSQNFLQLVDMLSAVPEGFAVMNGTEEYGLFAIMSGADGLVSGGASALPELMKSMVASEARGDHRAALAAQRKVQQVKGLVRPGQIAAYYEILSARGVDCGTPRAPLLPLDRGASAKMLAGLRRLGLL